MTTTDRQRKEKNRLAQRNFRIRKRDSETNRAKQIGSLEQELEFMKRENVSLKEENTNIKQDHAFLVHKHESLEGRYRNIELQLDSLHTTLETNTRTPDLTTRNTVPAASLVSDLALHPRHPDQLPSSETERDDIMIDAWDSFLAPLSDSIDWLSGPSSLLDARPHIVDPSIEGLKQTDGDQARETSDLGEKSKPAPSEASQDGFSDLDTMLRTIGSDSDPVLQVSCPSQDFTILTSSDYGSQFDDLSPQQLSTDGLVYSHSVGSNYYPALSPGRLFDMLLCSMNPPTNGWLEQGLLQPTLGTHLQFWGAMPSQCQYSFKDLNGETLC